MNVATQSNNATKIEERGIIKRGKYIFLITGAFVTMLLPPLSKLEEKAFQNTSPENTNMVGDIPPDDEPSFFDAKVRITTMSAG